MSTTIDPVTALAIAYARNKDEIRRAEEYRLARQAQQRRVSARKTTNRSSRRTGLRRLLPRRSASVPT
jgi:hypothetical protein